MSAAGREHICKTMGVAWLCRTAACAPLTRARAPAPVQRLQCNDSPRCNALWHARTGLHQHTPLFVLFANNCWQACLFTSLFRQWHCDCPRAHIVCLHKQTAATANLAHLKRGAAREITARQGFKPSSARSVGHPQQQHTSTHAQKKSKGITRCRWQPKTRQSTTNNKPSSRELAHMPAGLACNVSMVCTCQGWWDAL